METYLFYLYLKFARDNKQTFWPKLLSRPVTVIIFFILTLVACIAGTILSLCGKTSIALITLVGEIVCVIFFNFFTERYKINFCDSEYGTYEEYCMKLLEFLKQYKISENDLPEIYERICNKMDNMKTEEDKIKLRNERWLQTLIIPTVIALITAVIAKQNDVMQMLTYTFTIVIIFSVIYGIFSLIKSITFFHKKHKIKQMECFANDLNSITFFINHK